MSHNGAARTPLATRAKKAFLTCWGKNGMKKNLINRQNQYTWPSDYAILTLSILTHTEDVKVKTLQTMESDLVKMYFMSFNWKHKFKNMFNIYLCLDILFDK